MRLATIKVNSNEECCMVIDEKCLLISDLNECMNKGFRTDFLEMIENDEIDSLNEYYKNLNNEELKLFSDKFLDIKNVKFAPLYRKPNKIWGIGLNYKNHAADLKEVSPSEEPASFMKPNTAIIGFNDNIEIPIQSNKTTGEAELGVIIGKKCKDIEMDDWLSVVAGYTTIIDMTAEDILRKNPRFLTRSKSFDTFFSFGPVFITPDEIEDVLKLEVSTVINNEIYAKNVVSNMTFTPDYLVSFHSKVMTLLPGDIISTGTPRAVHINDGDVVECRITGFRSLINSVVDKKIL
ncbi:fumarylacetoacetate hydrolase family protein [Clostridiaceae bacterium HSG29]|nr:fumarylacetoacetate hydrolase family protein [Clostridiaceae bacterium HSG29]